MNTEQSFIPLQVTQTLSQLDNVYEVRMFGWLIAKAQSVLKLYNKDLSEINMQHALNLVRVTFPAKYLLSPGDTNYSGVRKAFNLSTKRVLFEREGREYYLNIIAFPEFQKVGAQKQVTFVIHNAYWHALLDFSKGYRLIDLKTYMRLSTPYAATMYILVSQQTDPMHYHIATLRKIMGCEGKKSYERGFNFINRIIEPSKRELDRKAPFTFDWTTSRTGRGGKFEEITIIPHGNAAYSPDLDNARMGEDIQLQRLRLTEDVQRYLADSYAMTAKEMEVVEKWLLKIPSAEEQLRLLERVRHAARRRGTRNAKGYLVNSLKNAI